MSKFDTQDPAFFFAIKNPRQFAENVPLALSSGTVDRMLLSQGTPLPCRREAREGAPQAIRLRRTIRPGGNMKTKLLRYACVTAVFSTVSMAEAAPWVPCGQIRNINMSSCELTGRPLTQHEYGIRWNSSEPLPIACVHWNRGARIHNKEPYFVLSDNPKTGQRWGGFVLYQGTDDPGDDACGSGYLHQYWFLDSNNVVSVPGGSGCQFDTQIYCRLR